MSKLTSEQKNTQIVLYKILEQALRMLHPVMPFITEEIWQDLPRQKDDKNSIMISEWPQSKEKMVDPVIDESMGVIIDLIQTVRNIKANWKIEPKKFIDISVKTMSEKQVKMIRDNEIYIKRLARVQDITVGIDVEKPKHAGIAVIGELEIFVPLEGIIDIEKEKQRISNLIDDLKKRLSIVTGKLNNCRYKTHNKNTNKSNGQKAK
jgi:valyl-tRNA synthetase